MTDTSVADTGTSAADVLNVSPPPPPFYEGFQNADLKAAAATSGFASSEDAFAVAHKLSAFKDADPASLLVAPAADAKPEEHMKVLERLGAPKDAAAYGLDKIEGVDAELAGAAQGWFKDAGLLPWQAQLVAQKQMEFAKTQGEAMVREETAAAERELAALKTEWSADYDANRAHAQRAAKAMGFTAEEINYLESGVGVAKVLKGLSRLGMLIKEGDFVDGAGGAGPKETMKQRWYGDDGFNGAKSST